MCKNFDYFRHSEVTISNALSLEQKTGTPNEQILTPASKLVDSYVAHRLQSFVHRQGRYYSDLIRESKPDFRAQAQKIGSTISPQTAAKLYKQVGLPTFSSLAKLMEERGREILIILEPFENTQKKKLWVRFSAQESAGYAVSSLLRGLLRQDKRSRMHLSKLSGISLSTIRRLETQTTNPLFDESIVCPNIETVCRLAAANQYRMSILFCRSTSDADRLS